MSFTDRISSLFGKAQPPSGIVSPSLLEVDFSSISSYRSAALLSLAESASLPALLMCDLLISFFSESSPSCKDGMWKVFVWSDSPSGSSPIGTLASKKPALVDGKRALVAEDLLWQQLFNQPSSPNLSRARIVEVGEGGKKKGWKLETRNYSSHPLVALAQAREEFGDELGGIYDGKRSYPDPQILVDFSSLHEWVEAASGLERKKRFRIYSLLLEMKDALSYYMNVGGKAKSLVDSKMREISFFNRYVLLPPKFDTSNMVEGVDYVQKQGLAISKLPILVESLSLKKNVGKFFLSLSDVPPSTFSLDQPLWQVSFKKSHISDISVEYRDLKEETRLTYRSVEWKDAMFPLSMSESYSKLLFREDVVLRLEP